MPLKGKTDKRLKYWGKYPFEWNWMTASEKSKWYRENGSINIVIEDYLCPHCEKDFTTKWNRDRHVKRQICRMNTVIVPTEPEEAKRPIHLEQKPIHLKPKPKEKKECCVCNICKLTFISKEYFDKHTEKYHQSTSPTS
ncbi:MAG: hypothetical protein EOO20_13940 [Chryseobacterium sp.]|nr:MAG: hypothetical protein EOO20_13940 [Chryseobacterium sp.]